MRTAKTNVCRAEPPACTLFMTSLCQFRCSWCRRSRIGVSETPPMSLGVVRRLLERYPDIGVFALAGQGEPTLAPEFAALVRWLAGAGKRIILDTNGLHPEPVRGLRGCFARISLSLYGYDDVSYKAWTGVPAFAQVMASYRLFREVCENVCITYIMDKDKPEDMERVFALCDELRPTRLLLYNPLCYDVSDAAQAAKIITTEDAAIIERIGTLAAGRRYPVDQPPYPDFSKPLNSCRSYCQVVNVDGNGDIGGCLRQKIPAAVFGNVFRDEDCFNTPEMLRLRRLQMTGRPPHAECAVCFGNWGYGDCNALVWRKNFLKRGAA
jgi:pyruvate-formate lyase-activating enzyme